MAADTVSRFSLTMDKFMGVLADMIDELFDEELITFNRSTVQTYGFLMKTQPAVDLVWAVASTHEHWALVLSRDPKFIFDIFATFLKQSGKPIDPEMISAPFRCYEEMKNSDEWKDVEEDDWPVNQEDLDTIWDYIRVMVGLSCTHAYEERKAVDDGRKRKSDVEPLYYEMDVDRWVTAFKITIR